MTSSGASPDTLTNLARGMRRCMARGLIYSHTNSPGL
jgi:hypothetical protein